MFYYNVLHATPDDDMTDPGVCDFGDCNNDGQVTIDELVTMVDLSLAGTVAAVAGMDMAVGQDIADSSCQNGLDPKTGEVDINDLIHAVNVALDGPPPPPPPPTPLPLDQQPLSQIELDDPADARSTSTPMEETPTPEMETPTPDVCETCTCEDCRSGGCFDDDGYLCPQCDSCPPLTDTPEPTPTPGRPCTFNVSATEVNDNDSIDVTFDINPPIAQSPGGFIIEFYIDGTLLAEDYEAARPAGQSVVASGSETLYVVCPIETDPVVAQVGARVYNASHSAVLCADAKEVAIYSNGDCDFAAARDIQPGRRRVGVSHFTKTIR